MLTYLVKAAKSKTMWFSVAVVTVGVVEQNLSLFEQYVGNEHFGLFTVGVGVVSALLRVVTTQSITEK